MSQTSIINLLFDAVVTQMEGFLLLQLRIQLRRWTFPLKLGGTLGWLMER